MLIQLVFVALGAKFELCSLNRYPLVNACASPSFSVRISCFALLCIASPSFSYISTDAHCIVQSLKARKGAHSQKPCNF
ncbi:hypothetical protein EYC84_007231 [Monilinia fructicola]|uniref:Uncharacterized protein n=1 Tax=Monilinia fructicola TaxID=38448 RepID=A0A5M9K9R0_MONFR|nr:hypothetical protein EYC84_007231 [Monilinia fructicola]